MKTGLRQQIDLIRDLRKIENTPMAVKWLRKWLRDNGYETAPENCKHSTVFRITGRCTDCGEVPPAELSDEEALEALRDQINR